MLYSPVDRDSILRGAGPVHRKEGPEFLTIVCMYGPSGKAIGYFIYFSHYVYSFEHYISLGSLHKYVPGNSCKGQVPGFV